MNKEMFILLILVKYQPHSWPNFLPKNGKILPEMLEFHPNQPKIYQFWAKSFLPKSNCTGFS
jgi:hypothetical protein